MQSDAVSKAVLALLLFLSIVCWMIFLLKLVVSIVKHNNLFQSLLYLSVRHSTKDLNEYAERNPDALVSYMIKKHNVFTHALVAKRDLITQDYTREVIAQHGEHVLDQLVEQEQSLLPILSTTAIVAPLLGLFGTVWGLVHAFLNIAQQHTADIATVAPGIAEALITTLVGLVVAIPAQVMYTVLSARVRRFEGLLMRCSDIITVVFQHLS
jgi:biopolymer transport protein ExbB/TolQ